jgi:PPOX class probable F420-dependent enzyme
MQLSAAQIAFLQERRYATVATLNADGSIQQTVVWYLLDGDVLRLSVGANSVKVRNLQRNATVSLSVEDGVRYLSLSGTATVEPADLELRRRLAARYLDPERIEAWLARRPDAARASVRIAIRRAYGQGV